MFGNSYIKTENKERDKIFEFLIVLTLIAVLVFIGINYYTKPIGKSQRSVIEFHAGIFSRMIANVQAVGRSSHKNRIMIGDTVFFLNENGWPANTNGKMSPKLRNQSETECQQLWNAVFTNAPTSRIGANSYKKNVDYVISLNKNVICRYQLARKQEGSYFFDYDVSNGAVTVIRPEEQ
ncbi:MAG: hypothetical protein K6L76_00170 [Agarilytica sp.]